MGEVKHRSLERLSNRNKWAYSFGGIGRDMSYQLWANYLTVFILLTRSVTPEQFALIGSMMIALRIFDALNDPIMGGIVERTATKWGKFKPWIMIGMVTNCAVLLATFCSPLTGRDFVIFFPFAYVLWDITFTMNDIGYWAMLPSLTSNEDDRNKLSTWANLLAGIGAGIASVSIPTLTNGDIAIKLYGGAVNGYIIVTVVICAFFFGCQLLTTLAVKEKPVVKQVLPDSEKQGLMHMFKVMKRNDQLKVMSLLWLCFNPGRSLVGGLQTYYMYFTYGYNGMIMSVFTILGGIASGLMIFYPLLAKRFSRKQIAKISWLLVAVGYLGFLAVGLLWTAASSFYLLAVCATFFNVGTTMLYMVQTVSIANVVEYNDYTTGRREEGIIFSVRPFMEKIGSAIVIGLVTLIFSVLGVTSYTNRISDVEQLSTKGEIDGDQMAAAINNIIGDVPDSMKKWLVVCMTVIPFVLVSLSVVIYLRKYKITEGFYQDMMDEIYARDAENGENGEEIFPGETVGDEEIIAEHTATAENALEELSDAVLTENETEGHDEN